MKSRSTPTTMPGGVPRQISEAFVARQEEPYGPYPRLASLPGAREVLVRRHSREAPAGDASGATFPHLRQDLRTSAPEAASGEADSGLLRFLFVPTRVIAA